MNSETNITVARDAYGEYFFKDRAALEPLIVGGLHFNSPRDNRIDRGTSSAAGRARSQVGMGR